MGTTHRVVFSESAAPVPGAPVRFTESITASVINGNVGKRKALVRIISPGFGNSADGFYYPKHVLQAAARRFTGVKSYFNHPSDKQATIGRRDVRDWCGTFQESYWHEGPDVPQGEIRAVFEAYDPWLMERMRVAPDQIAFSMRSIGSASSGVVEGRHCRMAESIDEVDSVDVVHAAGARGGVITIIEESERTGTSITFSEDDRREIEHERLLRMDLKDASQDDARKLHPEWFTGVPPSTVPATMQEALAPYVQRIEAQETKNAALERRINIDATMNKVRGALVPLRIAPAMAERVVAHFSESTSGFETATYKDDAALLAAVTQAVTAEQTYAQQVAQGARPAGISGFGVSQPVPFSESGAMAPPNPLATTAGQGPVGGFPAPAPQLPYGAPVPQGQQVPFGMVPSGGITPPPYNPLMAGQYGAPGGFLPSAPAPVGGYQQAPQGAAPVAPPAGQTGYAQPQPYQPPVDPTAAAFQEAARGMDALLSSGPRLPQVPTPEQVAAARMEQLTNATARTR